jgi:cell division protease FtsH
MVARLGMSELGPISVHGLDGADGTVPPPSDQLIARIDAEAAKLLDDAGSRAGDLVQLHREVLETLVARLVEAESLEGDVLRAILAPITHKDDGPAVAQPLEAVPQTLTDESSAVT